MSAEYPLVLTAAMWYFVCVCTLPSYAVVFLHKRHCILCISILNAATLLLRNNFRSDNKGFAQIDLQRQVFNNPYLKLHLMLSSGYGASLLDYNHSQTILGFGISLGE